MILIGNAYETRHDTRPHGFDHCVFVIRSGPHKKFAQRTINARRIVFTEPNVAAEKEVTCPGVWVLRDELWRAAVY